MDTKRPTRVPIRVRSEGSRSVWVRMAGVSLDRTSGEITYTLEQCGPPYHFPHRRRPSMKGKSR